MNKNSTPLPITQPPTPNDGLKVVITHDWLVGGGAERVVIELHKLYPDAPIYTSYCTPEWRERLDGKVVTGYLQRFGRFRKYLPPLQYLWFRSLDLRKYDLIISSAGNGMAKAVRRSVHTTHICYCHTPVHYLWRHFDRYIERPGFGIFNPIARLGLRALVAPLRKLDFDAAQAVDYFVANSTHIQTDIKKYYKKDSVVIHPPVDTQRFAPQSPKSEIRNTAAKRRGFITVGRLAPMKRTDLVVQACTNLGLPLTVIGRGPDYEKLVRIAGPTVRFLTNASDEDVAKELSKAEGFIFASFEDFGITPVEAMAAGTPVIAYKVAGALDYVVEGKTGTYFDQQTVESLEKALLNFATKKFNEHTIRQAAETFDTARFSEKIIKFIASLPLKTGSM